MSLSREKHRLSPLNRHETLVEVHGKTPEKETPLSSPKKSEIKPRNPPNQSKDDTTSIETLQHNVMTVEDAKERIQRARESWIESEVNVSADSELPIHDQIKQGIIGYIENEIKKSDTTIKLPASAFVTYGHNESDENLKIPKHGSRPSSGHKERKSPSRRKKKRHSSRHRDSIGDFEATVSSLNALEKVDDYLRQYHKDEVITLSGDLEIEQNDFVNNNKGGKENKVKVRKSRRRTRDDGRGDRNANADISPKVFDPTTGRVPKHSPISKPARPTLDLSSMLDGLDSDVNSYQGHQIDNPFSSPSPMTSPNDCPLDSPFGDRRPDKVFVQRGGTFKAVAREKVLGEAQRRADEQKYFRLGDITPLDVAIIVQRVWKGAALACHGMLAGLALMHLLVICYSDGLDAGHLSFHSAVTMPYVAAYYFLCVCCLLSALDRLDITGMDMVHGLQSYAPAIALVVVYVICLAICTSARLYDERMAYQFSLIPTINNNTAISLNSTNMSVPGYYITWTHFSIWRSVLAIMGAVYIVFADPVDMLHNNLGKLLQFKHSLQSIGG